MNRIVGIVAASAVCLLAAGCHADRPKPPVTAAFTASTAAPPAPCGEAPADAAFVIAVEPRAGARVTPPFEVRGCSRTFESTVVWTLRDRKGAVLAQGHTTGGGVDGPAEFRFQVAVPSAAPGLVHLEVEEPKVADEGEGFPPGRTVLPLVLAL